MRICNQKAIFRYVLSHAKQKIFAIFMAPMKVDNNKNEDSALCDACDGCTQRILSLASFIFIFSEVLCFSELTIE